MNTELLRTDKIFYSLDILYKVLTAWQIENEPTGPNVNLYSQLHVNSCLCHGNTQPM